MLKKFYFILLLCVVVCANNDFILHKDLQKHIQSITTGNNFSSTNINEQAKALQEENMINNFTLDDIHNLQKDFEGSTTRKDFNGNDFSLGIYDSQGLKVLAEFEIIHKYNSADLKIFYNNNTFIFDDIHAICNNSVVSFNPKRQKKSTSINISSCSGNYYYDIQYINSVSKTFANNCSNRYRGSLTSQSYQCRYYKDGNCCYERTYTCTINFANYPMFQLKADKNNILLEDHKKDLLSEEFDLAKEKFVSNEDLLINPNSCLCVSESCSKNTANNLYLDNLIRNLITDISKHHVVLKQELRDNKLILYTVDTNADPESQNFENKEIIDIDIHSNTADLNDTISNNITEEELKIKEANKESFENAIEHQDFAKAALQEQYDFSKTVKDNKDGTISFDSSILNATMDNSIDVSSVKDFETPPSKKCIVQYEEKEPMLKSNFQGSELRATRNNSESLFVKTEVRQCNYDLKTKKHTCPIKDNEYIVKHKKINMKGNFTGVSDEDCSEKIDSNSLVKLALANEITKETKKNFKGDYESAIDAAAIIENLRIFKGLVGRIEDKKHILVTRSYKCCQNNDGDKFESHFPYSIKNLDTPEKTNNFCKAYEKDIKSKYNENCEQYIARAKGFYNLQKIKVNGPTPYCNMTYLYPKVAQNEFGSSEAKLGDFFSGLFKDLGGILGFVSRGNNTKKCIDDSNHVAIAGKQLRKACYPTGYTTENKYIKLGFIKIKRWTAYRRHLCCVDNDLTRLIQEEAARQLGRSVASMCGGLTIKEFESLDLSKIDPSELLAAMGATVGDAEKNLVDKFDAENINFGDVDSFLNKTTGINNLNKGIDQKYNKDKAIQNTPQGQDRLYKETDLNKLKKEL